MSKLVNFYKFFSNVVKPTKIKLNEFKLNRSQCKLNRHEQKLSNYSKGNLTCNYAKPPLLHFSNKLRSLWPRKTYNVLVALSILRWMGFEEEDVKKESELIMTLKRAVLSTQRQEYDKAEQLLHIALRLAQQQQNSQGVLYCYDLMANLALERFELDKAEKLFVSVMQMLLSGGAEQDDKRMIHISLKLARISHLKAEEEKAELGYKWCLENIEKQKNKDIDFQILYGVIQDWYAQFLLDRGQTQKSLVHLKEAYTVSLETRGKNSEQSMLLLNDLGITSWRAGDLEGAESFLKQAMDIGKAVEDKSHVGVVHANLGLIFLQRGIMEKAKKYCKEAWHLGRKHENTESVEQANYCLDQIKINLEK